MAVHTFELLQGAVRGTLATADEAAVRAALDA